MRLLIIALLVCASCAASSAGEPPRGLFARTGTGLSYRPGFTHVHGSGPGLGKQQRAVFARIAGPEPGKK